jgi:RNA polymerase sigma factor for flagellar operon FliA
VLPDRLRTVVVRYFFEERPMTEIAVELGVSESRVSQMRAEALSMLRDGMNAQLDPSLVASADRPGGCAARRREAYFAEVAARGDVRSRISGQLPAYASAAYASVAATA